MPKLILHIGTEKTGTTAIQTFLHENRQALFVRHGLFVPTQYARYNNHRCLLEIVPGLMAPQADLHAELAHTLGRPDLVSQLRAQWAEGFARDTAHFGDATFVLSSEHFHSRVRELDEISLFLKFLTAHFSEIRILVFLREPYSCALALRSTLISNGHYLPDPLRPDDERVQLLSDHADTLAKWQAALHAVGGETITLEPHVYSPSEFPGRCAAQNFAKLLGVSESQTLSFPNRDVNSSLAPRELNLLNQINSMSFANPDESFSEELVQARDLLSKLKEQPAYTTHQAPTPDGALKQTYASYYAESNAKVREAFFPERPALFVEEHPLDRTLLDLSEEIFLRLSGLESPQQMLWELRQLTKESP